MTKEKNNNDEIILSLKERIKDKKKELSATERFSPKTNCVLTLDNVQYHLNVLVEDSLTLLLVKLNGYKMSAKNLSINNIKVSGFTIDEWMGDIQSKLNVLNRKNEETKLKTMERKLSDLLSIDKKTELEIDAIKKELGL